MIILKCNSLHRKEFNEFTINTLKILEKDILSSVNSLKYNKWLSGPKIIYNEVGHMFDLLIYLS